MPSSAYEQWTGDRRRKIDELFSAHATVGGSGRGRRWRTEQLNWSMTLRLAGEFQGFARELHNEAVECCVNYIAKINPEFANVTRTNMIINRQLDRGNAQPGAIGSDYSRIGIVLWPALETANKKAKTWNKELESLNIARNAIAHDDQKEFLRLKDVGKLPIKKATVENWRKSLDSLATTMDDVVGDYLGTFLRGPRPW
jgi:hypothetical protein